MSDVAVTNNPDKSRYEAMIDGQLAGFVEYRATEGVVTLPHTEVDSAFEGKGVGSALARGALDDIRSSGRQVEPVCPFIKSWIDKHPDYRSLVAGS